MKSLLSLLLCTLLSCSRKTDADAPGSWSILFGTSVKLTVRGYTQDMMEPFLSRDGKYLFFNNLNDPAVNTNLNYAQKVNDSTFNYIGEIPGVNTNALDGVASMDSLGNFYFISTRSYDQSLSTVYTGLFSGTAVTGIGLVPGISENKPGQVEFDAAVSADGQRLYFSEGQFSAAGQLSAADLVAAVKDATGFHRLTNAAGGLQSINTSELEYAACISTDEKTLFFTRVPEITANAVPHIWYATRNSRDTPFALPREITALDGFVEAPSLSADGRLLYYHKKENGHFVLYYTAMQ